jgi:hypothetical protein
VVETGEKEKMIVKCLGEGMPLNVAFWSQGNTYKTVNSKL